MNLDLIGQNVIVDPQFFEEYQMIGSCKQVARKIGTITRLDIQEPSFSNDITEMVIVEFFMHTNRSFRIWTLEKYLMLTNDPVSIWKGK